jgi:hypothetical protein
MTTLKKTECSSQKWPAKVSSSTASLHKNGFGLALLQHNSTLTVLFMTSNMPGLYRSEFGYHSPTSSQNLGSKRAQYPPKWAKISINKPKNHKKISNHTIKPTLK